MDAMHITEIQSIYMVPLRAVVMFPQMMIHLDVGRKESINAFNAAFEEDKPILLVSQKNLNENPGQDDIYEIGTISRICQIQKLPNGLLRVLAEGVSRARVLGFAQEGEMRIARAIEVSGEAGADETHMQALRQTLLERFDELSQFASLPPEAIAAIASISDTGILADTIASKMLGDVEMEQEILSSFVVSQRVERLLEMLASRIEVRSLADAIDRKVRDQMEKNQREYYLREQEKVIRQELGDDEESAANAYRNRLAGLPIEGEALEKIEKEIGRLARLNPSSPETEVSRNYLDTVLALPWGVHTQDNLDLEHAFAVLNEEHFGLDKVKERIIEFLAVHALTKAKKGAVLCLVGPPGVGKTSIAQSVAKALERNFARLSLGGVHDESEIRGHRRTYIGSMPGRILTAMKQAGSMNPLILMDEIDKMAASHNGDPAAALLEVLDVEQNASFRDHYADIPFDLSSALFFVTANTLETVPKPLLDRMEIIEISSYTEQEKLEIAKRHLVKKQLERHGLKRRFLKIDDDILRQIISGYTREAGVRNLEREIATVCRKAAVMALQGKKTMKVTAKRLPELLGAPRFLRSAADEAPRVGAVNGLAWTSVGGEMLVVEAVPMKGSGQLLLTGNLGDVMQESAKAAVSYVRANAVSLGVDPEFYKTTDIHIHVPEGATPKDGPSAGVTIASAVASALSGRAARQDIAMTGEITLRGKVLPIGGLKEKALAAHRQGIKTVLFPADNLYDVDEIPAAVREELRLIMVKDISDVLHRILVQPEKPQGKKAMPLPVEAPAPLSGMQRPMA